MKNVTVKAVALAIAAALPGFAQATVDLNDTTTPGTAVYASELVEAGDTVLDTDIDTTSLLGFGVSLDQTRYIRFDLSNATFDGAVDAGDLTVGTIGTVDATERTVSAGGTSGDDFVIFQITSDGSYGAAEAVLFNLNAAGIVMTSTSEAAGITYSLYETGSSAVNGGSSGRLATASADVATLSTGLAFELTPATTTASVDELYEGFTTTGATPGLTATLTAIGGVDLSAVLGVLNPNTGAQVATTALLGADTAIVLSAADLSAAGSVFLDRNGGGCNNSDVDELEAVAGEGLESPVSLVIGDAAITGGELCFAANGNAIAAQDFLAALEVDPEVGSTTESVDAAAAGTFDHDGTVLKAPWVGGKAGTTSYVQLANQGNIDAPFEVTCFKPSGDSAAGTSGTVTAGNTARVAYTAMGCPAGTQSVTITLAVPEGNVIGASVRTNNTTGDLGIDSLTGNL